MGKVTNLALKQPLTRQ